MKTYWFWIQRNDSGQLERLPIIAESSHEAVRLLPSCISWDFSSRPIIAESSHEGSEIAKL